MKIVGFDWLTFYVTFTFQKSGISTVNIIFNTNNNIIIIHVKDKILPWFLSLCPQHQIHYPCWYIMIQPFVERTIPSYSSKTWIRISNWGIYWGLYHVFVNGSFCKINDFNQYNVFDINETRLLWFENFLLIHEYVLGQVYTL